MNMTRDERLAVVRSLRRQGFDETKSSPASIRPKCSQCQALVIQGVACHETGCPRSRPRRR